MIGKPGDPVARSARLAREGARPRRGALGPAVDAARPRRAAEARRASRRPGPLPLLEATLQIAAEEHESMDVLAQIARVETIGAEASERVAGLTNPFARLDAIRVFLFDELGFRGTSTTTTTRETRISTTSSSASSASR